MARLEDLLRGLRAEDLPPGYEDLGPLLTAIDAAVTAIGNAFAGNITLTDNVSVEQLYVQLSHGVPQPVSLKKLKRVGSVIGYSAGVDSGGKAHAFMFPPEVKPSSTAGMAQVVGYFRDPTAKRVQCSVWIEPNGVSTSKLAAGLTLPIFANNAAALAGGLAVGTLYRTGGDPDPVSVVH